MIQIHTSDDGKNWARLIINRMEYGRKYCGYAQRMAREVLGLDQPAPVRRLRVGHDGRVQREDDQQAHAPEPEFA